MPIARYPRRYQYDTTPPSHILLIFAALLLLTLAACNIDAEPEISQEALPKTLDEQFLEVGADIPGFAGIYYDDDNNVVVNIIKGELQTASVINIEDALTKVFGPDALGSVQNLSGQAVAPNLKTKEVKYSFEELHKLLDKIERKAEQKGINIVDIDEKVNKIYLGVEDEKTAAKLRKRFTKLNLPEDAVTVAVEKALEPMATTLESTVRPTQGGLAIDQNPGGTCTLGFNAVMSGVKGFVTNSHCTTQIGQVDGTTFRQSYGSSNKVGREIVDPRFNTSGGLWCYLGRNCRYSDAAFIKYDSGISVGLGKIAHVTYNPGKVIFSSSPLPIYIKRTDNSQLYSGRLMTKLGKETGLTTGKITRTCAKFGQRNTNGKFVCQFLVKAKAEGGDSGAPVYTPVYTTEGTGVALSGIAWGASSDSFGFSPMSGIERDFNMSLKVK